MNEFSVVSKEELESVEGGKMPKPPGSIFDTILKAITDILKPGPLLVVK